MGRRPKDEAEEVPQIEAPWWTTEEVAEALGKGKMTIREIAKQMGIFGNTRRMKYSLTDVLMIRKELNRQQGDKKRNHKKKTEELKQMIQAKDRGEL